MLKEQGENVKTSAKVSVIIPVYNQEQLVLRAIESIPERNDIEVIVVDDGSTDNTAINIFDRFGKKVHLLMKEHSGVADTVNLGLSIAKGEYIVLLGSDDYFIADQFEECMKQLDGTDLIYFDIRVNNGDIWLVTPEVKEELCGSVKFMRREFVGNTRCAARETGEDRPFYYELLDKNPTEKFTHLIVKHYNHPREGSLTDLARKGILKDNFERKRKHAN